MSDLRTDNSPEDYLRWYYLTEVWQRTKYRGVPILKSVSDLWNYQEILTELDPGLVVEFGTFFGGSALYFADTARCPVLSIDIDHSPVREAVRKHPGIELLQASTDSPEAANRIRQLREKIPGRRVFFIVDSDHTKKHVLAELASLRSLTLPGDYVIVEDGIINGHPVLPDWGEGPFEALAEYFKQFPHDYSHDIEREKKFGFTFAPNGFLIRR